MSAEEIPLTEKWISLCQTLSKGKPLTRLSSRPMLHPRRRASSVPRRAGLGGWSENPICPSQMARALELKRSVWELQWKLRAPTARVLSCTAFRQRAIGMGSCHPPRGVQTPEATSSSDVLVVTSRTRGTPSPRWRPLVSPIVSPAGAGIAPPLRPSRGAKAARGRPGGREASLRRETGPYGDTCGICHTGNGRVVCFWLITFLLTLSAFLVWPFHASLNFIGRFTEGLFGEPFLGRIHLRSHA